MSENNKLNWLELNGVRYGLGKSIYAELDMSLERFVELLGRDFYCPTLSSAPTSSTVTYVDTDDDTHTFQIGQPCRWEEDGSWRLAVCLDNTGSASQWYVLPVKVSELTNDAGYLTEHQDISGLATKEELNKKVDKVDGKQLSTEDFTTLLKNKLDGLSNYDDTEISQAVSKLRTDLDALVSGDTTTAIKTFNEVVAFLDGISDTEDLSGIIASIEQQIAGKQDKLVSGTNIKTINGQDVLGEGDIVIEGGNSEANVGAVDTDDFVEEPDLAKYLTTKPQSFTDEEKQQVKDNLGIVETRDYETLTVTVQGLTEGFTVYVKDESGNILGMQTTTSKTYRIKEKTKYYVSADEADGYDKPSDSDLRTATAYADWSIDMIYVFHPGTKKPANGVYIQDTDGFCQTVDEWTGAYTPNGVAVVTDNCSFVIALQDAHSSTCQWGSSGTTVSGIVTTSTESTAAGDYKGESNTTTILNQLGNSSSTDDAPAAYYCRAFAFPNGKEGYLGAAGEWKAAINNKAAIVSALSKCGGSAMSSYYWSSTQYDSGSSWCIYLYSDVSNYNYKSNISHVRAFSAI